MPPPRELSLSLQPDGTVLIDYDASRPPHVFFDTCVLRGLGKGGMDALRRLQTQRGFRFRYNMQNFTELVSHLGDAATGREEHELVRTFRRFQAPFKRIVDLFELEGSASRTRRGEFYWGAPDRGTNPLPG